MSKEKETDGGLIGENIHHGRPKDEEPHVKRSTKKKKEIVEYLVRVDLDKLGIDDQQFEEMKELFKMFDIDRDGVLTFKEFERLTGVLGRTGSEEKARKFAQSISVDQTECSVSFTEYLNMMANQRNDEPSPESLLDAFEIFDKGGLGRISEAHFRRIMKCKLGEDVAELDEMLDEYRRVHSPSVPSTPEQDKYIGYRKFVQMLQE